MFDFQEEGWAVCKVFKKRMPTPIRKVGEYGSPCWYEDQVSFMQMQELESPNAKQVPYAASYGHQHYPCKQELEMQYNLTSHDTAAFLQLPQLESPTVPQSYGYDGRNNALQSSSSLPRGEHAQHGQQQNLHLLYGSNDDQVTDWRVLDKFVASQFGHEQHVSKEETSYSNVAEAEQINLLPNGPEKPEIDHKYASNSTSSQIDQWK